MAVFEITRPSAYLDPDTRIFEPFGRARHRGVEADIFGEVARGLRVYGSLAYLDAELAQDANPALIGNRPAAVPEWAVAGGFDADVPLVPNLAVTGRSGIWAGASSRARTCARSTISRFSISA